MPRFDHNAAEREMTRRARRPIASHQVTERQSRAFDFRTPGKGSAYAFSLTWTPGSLALAGDCGEIVLTNHSLGDLVGALSWAAGSEVSYLLEKTDRRKVYDPVATAHSIIEMATEAALWGASSRLQDHRQWRKERPEMFVWAEQLPGSSYYWYPADLSDWEVWAEERPPGLAFEPDTVFHRAQYSWEQDRVERIMAPPEGWDIWDKLREEFTPELDRESVFKSKTRRRIKAELLAYLREISQEKAVDLCSELGLNDYYGSYRHEGRSIQQIECVRHGAWLALLHLQPERAYTWSPAPWLPDPDAFPQAHAARVEHHRQQRIDYQAKQRAAA